MQWRQYAKSQTKGCGTHWMQWNSGIWWWGHCLWCKKVKPVDAVDAVHSGCSMQWTQWNSGIWWWGHCLWCKKVKPVDTVDAVCSGCSGIVVYSGGDIVFGAKRSYQWMHWMQYTSHTPPHTTIPLHPLCLLHTASTGLTFLHQRQCLHHHTPLFHCIHCFHCFHCASTASTVYCIYCVLHPLHLLV